MEVTKNTNKDKYKAYTLSTNDIKKPKVLKGDRAIGTQLYRLIMLNPGENPLYPEMGVGLVKNYRYMNTNDLQELADNIEDQVSRYLPQFQSVTVQLEINSTNNTLIINIAVDHTMYKIDTGSTATPITLSDI